MRRNRIKAVINVPRGGRSSASQVSGSDRPLTPITSNSPTVHHYEPSSPVTAFISQQQPSSRSSSPSPLNHKSSELLYKSPGTTPGTTKLVPLSPLGSPTDRERPTTPLMQLMPSSVLDHSFSASSTYFPISPGGIQRPSPSASPGSLIRYIPGGGVVPHPHSPQRPSPSPSPNRQQLVLFNSNSNSGDSHEFSRYMSLPSPGGIFAPRTPEGIESQSHHYHRSQTPTPTTGGGAFSSVMRDPANSIVNNSDLLRQRLAKPSPSLTVSKYQTLRKEFLAKATPNQAAPGAPERKQLTMLHFAFWNPPKKDKEKSASRHRASSVCSDLGPSSSSSSRPSEVEVKTSPSIKAEKDADVKTGIAARRVTVGDSPMFSPASHATEDTESISSDVESSTRKSVSIGPRVKVGPDGQLIIDEQSLVVETSESQRAKKQLSEMETVSGNFFAVGSSGLFRNKKNCRRGHDWSDKETIKFYKALSMCGTDFSMMTTLFPGRSRAELKAKFKREDRKNPGQISLALSCQEFDPNEGITDSEEESLKESEDLVIGGEGKSVKVKRRRKSNKKPLSEIERRLQDELEEVRASFTAGISSSASTVAPSTAEAHLRNLSHQSQRTENAENLLKPGKKKRTGGRVVATWKSNVIVDDVTGKPLPKPGKTIADFDGEMDLPPIKKQRQRRPKIKNVEVVQEKSSSSKSISKTSLKKPDEPPDSHSLDCIEILRFDDSDPLGLKVALPSSEHLDVELPSSENLTTLTPFTLLVLKDSVIPSTSEDIQIASSAPSAAISPKPTKKHKSSTRPSNVKVLPFRVPGPGPLGSTSPSIVDEIEIEISCQ